VCNYERKYATKLLNGRRKPSKDKRGRKSEYNDPQLIKTLKTIWMRSGQLCGKRLKPAIVYWLKPYEKHHGELSAECREKLLFFEAFSQKPAGRRLRGHIDQDGLKITLDEIEPPGRLFK